MVMANRQMMDELIYNLCDNAIRYNNPGGRVDVSVYREVDRTVLEVKDNGIGIPEKDQRGYLNDFTGWTRAVPSLREVPVWGSRS